MTTELERAWQNEAFATALRGLYEMHPLPDYKYQKVRWRHENDRERAVIHARCGGDLFLVEMFAVKVPPREIEAIHTLIYG